ncbi:PLD-like domain-containing protein [Ancylobacter rudongensis]|uniref:PLD-like domain-containing protein n=2 Tax=Ancylobacter rudongensis TaxID=177413 RepID=A0A1G4UTP9_9HYPH|nr:PLD-like domain-containing protein [Ancylobacter rudongensis]
MRLILGPEKSAINALRELHGQGEVRRITVLVAWARIAGVAYFLDMLGADSTKVHIVIGMAGAGTSAEALSYLRAHCGSVHLFHKHHRQTFHPKVYCFDGVGNPPDTARVLVGSSNLTGGGLFANFEASLRATLTPAAVDKDKQAWQSIVEAYDHLVASPFAEAIVSDERIQVLLEERYLSTEKSLRRRGRGDGEGAAKGSARRGKPEAPPPPLAVPKLPPPTKVFVDPTAASKPISPKAATSAASPTVLTAAPAPAFVADGTFFVRTLTANDVAKALGAQVGTFEPDLGIMARDQLPEFWGWPDKFKTVIHTKPREEWAARAIVFSTTRPAGVEIELMIWFREARLKTDDDPRPHAAEFRLRPGPKATFQSVLPAGFGVTSLVIIERLGNSEAYDFRLRIITQGEPEYDDYQSYLTTTRPGHRFGYGPDDTEG